MHKGGDFVPKQLKHTVTYRQTQLEQDLFKWVEEQRGIINAADFIKTILLEAKNNGKEKK